MGDRPHTPVLRLGRKIKVPTVRLIALLCDDTGVDTAAGGSRDRLRGRVGEGSRDAAAS